MQLCLPKNKTFIFIVWCPRTESNRGPIDYKSIALPAELQGHYIIMDGYLY